MVMAAIAANDVVAQRVIHETDPRWETLRAVVRENSLLLGNFTLSSGRNSSYLFQLRQTTLHPVGAFLTGEIITEFMDSHSIKNAGGLELGAVPIVTSIAIASHVIGRPINTFFVRKQRKEHGAKELVNGYLSDGDDILAVDDVTTTGGSMLKAISGIAKEHGSAVKYAISIVDREEGAAENLAAEGVELLSIFRKSDFEIGV